MSKTDTNALAFIQKQAAEIRRLTDDNEHLRAVARGHREIEEVLFDKNDITEFKLTSLRAVIERARDDLGSMVTGEETVDSLERFNATFHALDAALRDKGVEPCPLVGNRAHDAKRTVLHDTEKLSCGCGREKEVDTVPVGQCGRDDECCGAT